MANYINSIFNQGIENTFISNDSSGVPTNWYTDSSSILGSFDLSNNDNNYPGLRFNQSILQDVSNLEISKKYRLSWKYFTDSNLSGSTLRVSIDNTVLKTLQNIISTAPIQDFYDFTAFRKNHTIKFSAVDNSSSVVNIDDIEFKKIESEGIVLPGTEVGDTSNSYISLDSQALGGTFSLSTWAQWNDISANNQYLINFNDSIKEYPYIKKIKVETNDNSKSLSIRELQVWSGGVNVAPATNPLDYYISSKSLHLKTIRIENNSTVPVNINDIQVWAYNENYIDVSNTVVTQSSTVNLKKIRIETSSNEALKIQELQLWVDGQNLATDLSNITFQSSIANGNSHINIVDSSFNTYAETNPYNGEYLQLDLSNAISLDLIESIVYYKHNSSSREFSRLKLYDESDNILVTVDNSEPNSTYSVFQYKGPSYYYNTNTSGEYSTSKMINDQATNLNAKFLDLSGFDIVNDQSYGYTNIDYKRSTNIFGEFLKYRTKNTSTEYIDFTLANSIPVNDLQAIVITSLTDVSYNRLYNTVLYDQSGSSFHKIYNNLPATNYYVFKYKGPKYSQYNLGFSPDLSSTQIVDDNANITVTSLGIYGVNTKNLFGDYRNLNRIRFENTSTSSINLRELQVWKDGSNIALDCSSSVSNNIFLKKIEIETEDLIPLDSDLASYVNNLDHHIDFTNFLSSSSNYLTDIGNSSEKMNATLNGTALIDLSSSDLSGVRIAYDNSYSYVDLSDVSLNGVKTITTWIQFNNLDQSDQVIYDFYDLDNTFGKTEKTNQIVLSTGSNHTVSQKNNLNLKITSGLLPHKLKKVRIDAIDSSQIALKELQLWSNGENIAANRTKVHPPVYIKDITPYVPSNTPTYNWDFRVVSTTSVTDSIGGLTATYMNGLTSTVENGAYFAGGGAAANELNYIKLSNFELGGNCSLEFYARFDDSATYAKIFDFGDYNTSGNGNAIKFGRYNNNSTLYLDANSGSASFNRLGPSGTIIDNTFMHYVITFNSTTVTLYINGTSIANNTSFLNIPTRTRTYHQLGRSLYTSGTNTGAPSNQPTDQYFKGYIKYFRVWNGTALSSSQVTELYNNRNSGNDISISTTKVLGEFYDSSASASFTLSNQSYGNGTYIFNAVHSINRNYNPYENFGDVSKIFDNSTNHHSGGWAAYTSSDSSLFNVDYRRNIFTDTSGGRVIDLSSAAFTFKLPSPILLKSFYHNYDGSNNKQTFRNLKVYGKNETNVYTQLGRPIINDNSDVYQHFSYITDNSGILYDEYKFVYSGTFQTEEVINLTSVSNGASVYDISNSNYYGPNQYVNTVGTNDASGIFFGNSLILHDSNSNNLNVPTKSNIFNSTIWEGRNESKHIILDLGEKKEFNTFYIYDSPDLSGITDVSLAVIPNEPYYDLSAVNLQYSDSSWNSIQIQLAPLFNENRRFESSDFINNVINVSEANNKGMWTAYGGISKNGKYVVVGLYHDKKVYYSHDGGNNWNESTINIDTLTLVRGVSLSKNGKYSAFGNAGVNSSPHIYYSSDYGVTYNYINRIGASYFFTNTFINEDGTIVFVGGIEMNGGAPLYVGYIDKTNLTNTTWTAITGIGQQGTILSNDYYTKIFLASTTGTWIFDNNDTSKLTDSSYWNRSTNSNISNIPCNFHSSASQDLRVIVIPNDTDSSQEIWISTDYGNSFSNMYNSELTAFSTNSARASVSPDGQIVMLFRDNNNLYFYKVNENGTYYLLSIVPNSLYNETIHHAYQSNNGKILLLDNSYQTNNTNGAAIILNIRSNLTGNFIANFDPQYARYIRITAYNDGSRGQKGNLIKKIRVQKDTSSNFIIDEVNTLKFNNHLDFINYQSNSSLKYTDLAQSSIIYNDVDSSHNLNCSNVGTFDSSGLVLNNTQATLDGYTYSGSSTLIRSSLSIWAKWTDLLSAQTLFDFYNVNNDDLGDLPASIIGSNPTLSNGGAGSSSFAYVTISGNSDSWKNGTYKMTESFNEHFWRGFYVFINDLGFLSSNVYSNGNYTGSYSTTHTGGTINGTYVQIQFPFAFNPTGYKVQADNSTQRATAWSLLGSNDGSSWTLFSSDNGQGSTLATYTFSASGNYSYYRLVITNAAGGNNQNARIIRLYINGGYPSTTDNLSLNSSVGSGGSYSKIDLNISGSSSLNAAIKNTDLIQANTMHHMALTVGTNTKFYFDGNLIATESTPTSIQSTLIRSNQYLGSVGSNKVVTISQLSILGSELSQTEITSLYNLGYARKIVDKSYSLNLREIQVWVENNNIASSGTISYSGLYDNQGNTNTLKNYDLSSTDTLITNDVSGSFFELELANAVDMSNIQSIIIYNDVSNNYRFSNSTITLNDLFNRTVETIDYNSSFFNRIRLVKTNQLRLQVVELQIWINNQNITQNSTSKSIFLRSTKNGVPIDPTSTDWYAAGGYNPERAINNYVLHSDNGGTNWAATPDGNDEEVLELIFNDTYYDFFKIQSIVVFGAEYPYASYRMGNVTLEIYKDNNKLTEITTPYNGDGTAYDNFKNHYRFDGPDIGSVTTFSSSRSTSNIINSTVSEVYVNKIPLIHSNIVKFRGISNTETVKKIRNIRLQTTKYTSINVKELQVWNKRRNISNSTSLPTNSFILTGNSRSLTDKYSTTALTLNGSPTFDTNGVTLNGSGKYITIPQSILEFGSDDFTISLWVESIDDFNSTFQVIINMGNNTSNNNYLILVVQNSTNANGHSPREIYLHHKISSASSDVIGTNFIYPNDNLSHNYIITRKNSIIKVYIDAKHKVNLTFPTLVNSNYYIGTNVPSDTSYLHGIIKRVDIWKGIGF